MSDEFILVEMSIEDPDGNTSAAVQPDVARVSAAISKAGALHGTRLVTADSVDAGGMAILGDFIVKLSPVVIPALAGAAGAWLNAKYGRKFRMKVGDVEVEAPSEEAMQRLFEQAVAARDTPRIQKP